MIHLDTNVLIQSLVTGTTTSATFHLWLSAGEDIEISSVAWSEFLCGPMSTTDLDLARQLFPKVEPFLKTNAEKAAELFNLTGRRPRSLADCQIAAVALRCNALIATSDRNDFKLFEEHGVNLI